MREYKKPKYLAKLQKLSPEVKKLSDTVSVKCSLCDKEFESKVKYVVHPQRNVIYCKSCQRLNKCKLGGTFISYAQYAKYYRGAVKRKLDFDITIEDIEEVYLRQNKKCAYTGREVFFDYKDSRDRTITGEASIDRIDSNLGYTKDNIQIVVGAINLMKARMTTEKFLGLCRSVVRFRG